MQSTYAEVYTRQNLKLPLGVAGGTYTQAMLRQGREPIGAATMTKRPQIEQNVPSYGIHAIEGSSDILAESHFWCNMIAYEAARI